MILLILGGVCTVVTLPATAATYLDNFIGLGIAVLVHVLFFALGRGWILPLDSGDNRLRKFSVSAKQKP